MHRSVISDNGAAAANTKLGRPLIVGTKITTTAALIGGAGYAFSPLAAALLLFGVILASIAAFALRRASRRIDTILQELDVVTPAEVAGDDKTRPPGPRVAQRAGWAGKAG